MINKNFIYKIKILALCVFIFYFFALSVKPAEAGFFDWIHWLWKSKPATNKEESVPKKHYTLQIASEGSGIIIIGDGKIDCGQECSRIFLEQSSIELTAKPNSKYLFSEWIGCDSVTGDKCKVNLNKNRKVAAKFSVNKNLKLSLSSSASKSSSKAKIGNVASMMASSISSISQKSSSFSSKSSSGSKSSINSAITNNQSSSSVSVGNITEKNYLSSCADINKPGNYILPQDIAIADNTSKPCLDISNIQMVTINCQGHKISGNPIFLIENARQIKFQQCVFDPSNSNPNQQIHPTIKKTEDVTISDSVFNQRKIKEFWIDVWDSSNINFLNNTVYGAYQQFFSTETLIKNNNFILPQPPQWSPGGLINTFYGSSNQIIENVIDGGAKGYFEDQIGADDGIVISDESNDRMAGNNIKNVFDCGIETLHLIKNSVFEKNITRNAGLCGIGGWYWNSLIGNTFKDNMADNTQRAFNFYRAYGLHPGLETGKEHIVVKETKAYFKDNNFIRNLFINPRNPNVIDSSVFTQNTVSPESLSTWNGELPINESDIIVGNNLFSDNDFGTGVAPDFYPSAIATDNGGNKCGSGSVPNLHTYPNGYPLKCN